MPMYDFECRSCGRRFEQVKRYAERDAPESCPDCGKNAKRLLSGFAVGGMATGTGSDSGSSRGCTTGG